MTPVTEHLSMILAVFLELKKKITIGVLGYHFQTQPDTGMDLTLITKTLTAG